MKTISVKVDMQNNEGTESPWWAIIDPKQNFTVNEDGLHNIASMITGPFFSRGSAQQHLETRRYAFSKNAKVFCFSGYWSHEYKTAIRSATKNAEAQAQQREKVTPYDEIMKKCLGCKYAEWKRTKSGRLHPSGDGKCGYQIKIPQLPACMRWPYRIPPQPWGGFINRRDEFIDHCPYYEE